MYECRNYRPNKHRIQMQGAGHPHVGQIIADLYGEDGKLNRIAVVADLGYTNLATAEKYCQERNAKEQ